VKIFFQRDCSSDDGYGPADAWIGIGFRVPGGIGMGLGSEFYIGTLADGISDRFLGDSEYGTPEDDPVPDDDLSECIMIENTLQCWFTRSLGAGDVTYDVDLLSNIDILFASGLSSTDEPFQFHSHYSTAALELNVLTTAPEKQQFEAATFNATVQWILLGDSLIDFTMTLRNALDRSWIGVGLTTSSGMTTGSYFTCDNVDDDTAIIERYLDGTQTLPEQVESGSESLISMSKDDSDGQLTCTFSRKVSSNDLEAFISIAYGELSSDGVPLYHIAREQSSSALNLQSSSIVQVDSASGGEDSSSDIMLKAHGAIMAVVWLLLLPFGIFAGRFKDSAGLGKTDKDQPPLWWRIHQPLQYIGVILMIVAIVLAFVGAGPFTSLKFETTQSNGKHGLVGLFCFCFTLLQPILAIFRNGCSEEDKTKKRKIHRAWHITHIVFGYSAYILALAAVFMGLPEYTRSDEWETVYVVGFSLSVASILSAVIIMLIAICACSKQRNRLIPVVKAVKKEVQPLEYNNETLVPGPAANAVVQLSPGTGEKAEKNLQDTRRKKELKKPKRTSCNTKWVPWTLLGILVLGTILCVAIIVQAER
jgi:hypothetical protein